MLAENSSIPSCGSKWQHSQKWGACYQNLPERSGGYTWQEANKSCRALNEGSDLLWVDSDGEDDFIFENYLENKDNNSNSIWLGPIVDYGMLAK